MWVRYEDRIYTTNKGAGAADKPQQPRQSGCAIRGKIRIGHDARKKKTHDASRMTHVISGTCTACASVFIMYVYVSSSRYIIVVRKQV